MRLLYVYVGLNKYINSNKYILKCFSRVSISRILTFFKVFNEWWQNVSVCLHFKSPHPNIQENLFIGVVVSVLDMTHTSSEWIVGKQCFIEISLTWSLVGSTPLNFAGTCLKKKKKRKVVS